MNQNFPMMFNIQEELDKIGGSFEIIDKKWYLKLRIFPTSNLISKIKLDEKYILNCTDSFYDDETNSYGKNKILFRKFLFKYIIYNFSFFCHFYNFFSIIRRRIYFLYIITLMKRF